MATERVCDCLGQLWVRPHGLRRSHDGQTDAIKIGRPLIQKIDADPLRLAVVDAVVTLGRHLNITVITFKTNSGLRATLGIRWMQGFLLAYPWPEPITTVSLPVRRKLGL